ncbi:hypothetical protein M2397_005899 [Pseudomonas sp. BIGb0381]|uniref:hypothetical protein n=1 Tax=Pseudomonas TaxID=286 RepID=UPI002168BE19|nr:hypothetical protein [Pseudomonas sp. BIGb0381]MCS4315565.1 hypothetical protein [Pseudomonas sp. BIGb0381]
MPAFKVPPMSTDPDCFQRPALEGRMQAFGQRWMLDLGLMFCKECHECQAAVDAAKAFEHDGDCVYWQATPSTPWLELFGDLARYRKLFDPKGAGK